MTEEQFNILNSKLDTLLNALNGSPKKYSKPKAGSASKGASVSIEGVVQHVEEKQGSKCTFVVFNLDSTTKGKVSCKCFESALFEEFKEGVSLRLTGEFQEWKGYSSFIVRNAQPLSASANSSKQNAAQEDFDDEIPF